MTATAETAESPRVHHLSPEAFKQEGYARIESRCQSGATPAWDKANLLALQSRREREDREDPALISTNGNTDLRAYWDENRHNIRELEDKLQSFGIKLSGAGARLATWGGRGYAFEIATDRVCIYMCFDNPGGSERLLELRFSRQDGLSVWDYGENFTGFSLEFRITEFQERELHTGKQKQRLVFRGDSFYALALEESGEVKKVRRT